MHLKALQSLLFFLTLALLSCGGGSTVTAVSVTPESTDVAMGDSTVITASSSQSIVDNVTGEKVRFSFRVNESGATLDVINDRLDGNGEAKVIYRAGTRPGNDVVQVSFDSGATATVQIRVGTGQPVAPLQVSQVGTNTVRVTVKDTRGIPISNANILLSINIGQLEDTSGATDDDGIFETTFTLPAGVTSGRVTATVQGVAATATVSTAATSVARINLSQRGEMVQATALDRSGRPVPNARINFSIRSGTVGTAEAETNANGILETTFTLPPGTNSTTLVATSGSVSQTITVHRVPTQVSLIRLEQFGSQVLATALDSSGTPVPGILINFRITAGTIVPVDGGETNPNGLAEATINLPSEVNTARVLASSGSVSATLDVVRVTTSRSKSLFDNTLLGKSSETSAASIRMEQEGPTVRVWLSDNKGHPVQDATVRFHIDHGAINPSHVETNVNGVAEVSFHVLSHATQATLIAEGPGVTASLTVR